MYRNVTIAGLLGALIGGGIALLASGGDGVSSAEGAVRLTGDRLVDDSGRAVGRCVARSGATVCELRYALEDGELRASGAIRPDRRSVLSITGGTGQYAGAFGRVVADPAAPPRIDLAFDVVAGEVG